MSEEIKAEEAIESEPVEESAEEEVIVEEPKEEIELPAAGLIAASA